MLYIYTYIHTYTYDTHIHIQLNFKNQLYGVGAIVSPFFNQRENEVQNV